jgi:predicted membrane-bound mannosyltransferase
MPGHHPQAAAPAAEPRATFAIAAAWFVAGFAACWSVAGLEPNLVEEGLVLHVAQRLAAGEHLYRDIVFFTSPLPFELLGLLFRLFGEEIAVGRAAMAVFHGAAAGATFAFARRSGAGPLAFAAAAFVAAAPLLLFPLFSMFYYTPLAFCLGALAVDAAASRRWVEPWRSRCSPRWRSPPRRGGGWPAAARWRSAPVPWPC